MSTFLLIWANAWGRPGRDMAVILQILIAFLLFGTLHGIDVALAIALEKQRADFLYVNAAVRGDSLPSSYASKIARIDGGDQWHARIIRRS